RDVLATHGLNATYANCFHARKRLLEDLKADSVRFAETTKNLAPLASLGFGAGVSASSGGATTSIGLVTSVQVGRPKRGTPATGVAAPAKKQRLESAARQQQQQTAVSEEPQGCCFICPSVSTTASSSTWGAKHQVLQWQVRDERTVKTFFDLYDDNRRIEILKSGTYRLHLYFEAQGDGGDGDNDGAKYYLMVNSKPLSVFKDEEAAAEGSTEATQAASRDDVPLGVFNVAHVQLKKWDMIVLRRTRGGAESSANSDSEAQTPFGRFIIELVA
ncbi:hypothetical protein Gpo141_00014663, partial [Globisporangium polare]